MARSRKAQYEVAVIGSTIGSYRVLDKLGEGGMGEVYRARDTRLDRNVAIKILPGIFADDPDRLMRFEREAKTLASLNHPHIAQIFGVEESPSAGSGQGSGRALVMELVEGEDLSQWIVRGPMPLDEAIPIARQIAEALEAAHEAGIIHRDLKPANIKVRPDGTVKVLDFGLAKALEPAGASNPGVLMNSPTFTSPAFAQATAGQAPLTQMGLVLGTAAYMAPEQAKGKTVDKRVDIWAFGCVLYEMLTGTSPFAAESMSEVMAAVLTRELDWHALPPGTPPPVRRLLERCLTRDPRLRLRDIGEARVLLDGVLDGAASAPADATVPVRARSWPVLLLLATLAAGAAGYLLGGRAPAGPPRLLQTTFQQITEQPGVERQPTISPDGRMVVYVSEARGRSDLYSLRVGGRNAVLLTADSEHDNYAPAFSPDGNRIAFRSERDGGGIFVMEATGESVRRITDFGFDPRWSPDGAELAVADERVFDPMSRANDSRIWVVRVASGERRLVSEADGVGPRWSPGGRRIVFWGSRRERGNERDIFTVAADGSEAAAPVSVTDDADVDWSPTWSPDGRHVYFASSRGGTMNLWRIEIDEASGRAQGPAEPVTTPTAWSGGFEFAADGRTLVFSDLDERSVVFAAAFDPVQGRLTGPPRQVLQGRAINSIDLTRDGRTMAFSQRGRPWEALGIIRIDGSGWSRITGDDFFHRLPSWSPDGSRLLFYMNRGSGRLWTIRPDGSGLSEIALPTDLIGGVYPVWSPDGTQVAAAFDEEVAVLDLSASPARTLARFDADIDLRPFSWSPDGRRIAGAARYALRDDLIVLDLQTRTRRVVARDGSSPAWLPDGRRLLFAGLTHLSLLDTQTGRVDRLIPVPRAYDQWGRIVALSADGKTLVYVQTQSEGDVWMMTLHDD
jgi:eukaryotic-like serine/threonine-protein kinase